jgi:glycosyltransferase involved in cell wall biosynthesis
LNTYENFNKAPKMAGDYFDILNKVLNKLVAMLPRDRIVRFLPNSIILAEKINSAKNRYKIKTLYNGFSFQEFVNALMIKPNANTVEIYEKFKGFPTIVQVGTVNENKNQEFTLKCLKDIKSNIRNLRLLIIGDGVKKNELSNLVRANGLGKNVIFAGQTKRTDCLFLISKSNLLVLTSKSESFPNVLAEGQALSLPVITFDVGAASEIIENGNTGYVIPKGDSVMFTQRVIELLQYKRLATQMGRSGKKRIFNQFSMEQKVKKFISMLTQDLKTIKHVSFKKP